MEMSGQRHALAALYPRVKDLSVPIGQEAGWAPEPVLCLEHILKYCNVLGVLLFTMKLYCALKVNTLQLNTVGNSWNTRTRPTRTVSEHQLL
jgi:hypothetical protein